MLEDAYIGKRCKCEKELVAYSVCSKRTVGGEGSVVAVGCYTLRGRYVSVFGVKSGDLCGSEVAAARKANWHSDAGRK